MPSTLPFPRGVAILIGAAIVLGLLYWLQPIAAPIALAMLLAFLLSPLVTWLHRRGVPRAPAVGLVVFMTFTTLGCLGWLVERQIAGLVDSFPQYEENFNAKIASLHAGNIGVVSKLQRIATRITDRLKKTEPTDVARPDHGRGAVRVRVVSDDEPYQLSRVWSVLEPVLAPLAGLGLTIVLLIYMLMRREDLRDRVISLVGHRSLTLTTKAFDEAGSRILRYLLTQLLLNIAYGVVITIGLFLIGVPYAPLWGFLAAVLRYVPYLGSWLAALLPVGLSFLVFETWIAPLLVIALFLVIDLVLSMLIEPWLYGRGIGVSETATLVMIAFWAWLWGPIGLVLATPLTVCLVVLGRHVPYLKFFATLLGDEPALDAPVGYYQRLLARDQDEATDIAESYLKEHTLVKTYDELLLPGLAYAKRDLAREALSEEDQRFVLDATRDIAEALLSLQSKSNVGTTQSETHDRLSVLGVPARDESDDVALLMLKGLLDPNSYEFALTSATLLASEVIEEVKLRQPSVLFIATVAPGGVAQARLLCLRLRAEFPGLDVLVGRWAAKTDIDQARTKLLAAGASQFAITLDETCQQMETLRALGPHPVEREPLRSSQANSMDASRPLPGSSDIAEDPSMA